MPFGSGAPGLRDVSAVDLGASSADLLSVVNDVGSQVLVVAGGRFIVTEGATSASLAASSADGLAFRGYNAAPADASLANGECALWLDQTDGVGNTKLMVKAKSANGTVKTATIVLA